MTLSRFIVSETTLSGLTRIVRKPFTDQRGEFSRMYCAKEFRLIGIEETIQQINHSHSRKTGTIRGLHYQKPPYQETKIITCIKGAIYDVAVDIRKNSPTFLKWHSVTLSAENGELLVVGPGFAHGFQTLENDSEIIYFVTAQYEPSAEGGLQPFDTRLNINWPLVPSEISNKDARHLTIRESNFSGFLYE